MIGVNNLNTHTITLVRRESVNCQEAEKRFNDLVINNEDTTFDPAIVNQSPPHGKKYDFKNNQSIEFFRDNVTPEEKPICLKKAVMASRINTLLSLPMLLSMVMAQNLY